jgi:hypothetical protein
MRAAALAVAVLATLVPARAALAGDGFFVPPVKVDYGALAFSTEQGTHAGSQWLVGLNLATIYPKRIRFDIGVGYVGARFDNPFPATAMTPNRVTIVDGDPTLSLHGGYLELSHRLFGDGPWRTWLSGRGELASVSGAASLGAAARISTELWTGVKEAGRNGGIIGVFALGVWAEASARELGDRAVVGAASAGMSVRIPLMAVGR